MQYVVARTEGTPECPMRVLILGADLLANVQTAVGKLHILATLTGAYPLEQYAFPSLTLPWCRE